MKSKIENNVLITFNPEDLIDGFFECLDINEIGNLAFANCNDLTAVSLPNVIRINDMVTGQELRANTYLLTYVISNVVRDLQNPGTVSV